MLLLLFALLAQDPTTTPPSRMPFTVSVDQMTRPAPVAPDDGAAVPGWALTDPARWERSQCGDDGDEACRRGARNRLAMARASATDLLETPSAGGVAPAPTPQRCRMVTQRSETGFGGSFTRVCGDGASAERALEAHRAMMEDLGGRPAPEPCDRPAENESHDLWIARCRAMPQ
jgi:hypothetical protein